MTSFLCSVYLSCNKLKGKKPIYLGGLREKLLPCFWMPLAKLSVFVLIMFIQLRTDSSLPAMSIQFIFISG